MRVLVLNCGSSSLKFQVIETGEAGASPGGEKRLAHGLVDRIGEDARCVFEAPPASRYRRTLPVRNHEEAVREVLSWLGSLQGGELKKFDAAGHRVVHGGTRFPDSVVLDNQVVSSLEELNELAPLHNPACLSGIRAARAALGPSVPMVAAFDTSFHRTIPRHASVYALPYETSLRHGIRRYGFHGLAHRYAALRYAQVTATPLDRVDLVTLHLGNGCSACAIRGGESVDTSMGLTPLEGLVMGTRSGDLDPAVVSYLCRKEKLSPDEIESVLNTQSGLLGLSGRSNDMRDLIARVEEDERARLAVDLFCYRVRKYLGAYLAALGGAAAVIFSGGIGEYSPLVRARVCEAMEWCGLKMNAERNGAIRGDEGRVSSSDSAIAVYVIPVDEEVLIARDTAVLVGK